MEEKAKSSPKSSSPVIVANEILPSGCFRECSVDEAIREATNPRASSADDTSNTNDDCGGAKAKVSASDDYQQTETSHLRSFWIDAEIIDGNDLKSLPDELLNAIPPFAMRHLMQASQLTTPQTLVFPESVLMVFPILPPQSDSSSLSLQCCAAICLENLLITIVSANPIPRSNSDDDDKDTDTTQSLTSFYERVNVPRELFYKYKLPDAANTTAVLCALFTTQSSRVSHVVELMRAQAMNQYKQIQQDPKSVSKSNIMNLVNSLLQIESVADEQNQVYTVLSKEKEMAGTLDSKTLKQGLKALSATSSAVKRSVARLEKRQMHVYKMYESQQQEHANHRLNMLTIFSAVFLPITLLAGIWGMNFINMPELETENGYYFALATMGAIALVMTFGFWRRGWFDMSWYNSTS